MAGRRWAAALLSVLLVGWAPTLAGASVPGKAFTETGCEEYSDSVARLYTAGLGREPEQGGFEFWMNEYTNGRWLLPKMATFFTQSPEFEASYGALTDDGFVRQLYRNVLGREGELGGVAFWNEQMAAGMSRGTVLLRFAESPENIANSGTAEPALGPFNAGLPGPWTCAAPVPAPAPTTPAQQNAISKAESYLRFTSFSRSGLIDQLEFEGFSTAVATFAVDYLEIDFHAQAVEKAASYLDFTAFSRLGLIDQLEFEGFTRAEAIHGTDAQGTDYNRQAALKAASYLEFTSFSCQGLIAQLEFEKFTRAQATHGANSTGICD